MDIFPYDLAILICEYATEVPDNLGSKYIVAYWNIVFVPKHVMDHWNTIRITNNVNWNMTTSNNINLRWHTATTNTTSSNTINWNSPLIPEWNTTTFEPDWAKHRQLAEQLYQELINCR